MDRFRWVSVLAVVGCLIGLMSVGTGCRWMDRRHLYHGPDRLPPDAPFDLMGEYATSGIRLTWQGPGVAYDVQDCVLDESTGLWSTPRSTQLRPARTYQKKYAHVGDALARPMRFRVRSAGNKGWQTSEWTFWVRVDPPADQ